MTRQDVVKTLCERLQRAVVRELDHRALIEAAVTMLYAMDAALDEAAKAGGIGAPYAVQRYFERDTA